MFFYLSKIFALLFLPYPLFLILLLVLCLKLPSLALRLYLRIGFALLLLLSFLPFAHLLLFFLEFAYPKITLEKAPQADAIVVLAAMIRTPNMEGEEPEFNAAVDRILAAEKLFSLKKAPYILLSGASALLTQKGQPEALVLQKWLIQRKMPARQVLIETSSRNTVESALAVAQIAKKQGWQKILLVSSAYHIPRSLACFQKAQLKSIPIPVDYQSLKAFAWPEAAIPSLGGLALSTLALREYIGLLAYKLSGYI